MGATCACRSSWGLHVPAGASGGRPHVPARCLRLLHASMLLLAVAHPLQPHLHTCGNMSQGCSDTSWKQAAVAAAARPLQAVARLSWQSRLRSRASDAALQLTYTTLQYR